MVAQVVWPGRGRYGRAPSGRNVVSWGLGMTAYRLLTLTTARLSSEVRRLDHAS